VSLPKQSNWSSVVCLFMTFCLLAVAGCSGGAAPTKIYEGGGTIPEIVDQPEKPSPQPANRGPKK
jgi:hypothetical protein